MFLCISSLHPIRRHKCLAIIVSESKINEWIQSLIPPVERESGPLNPKFSMSIRLWHKTASIYPVCTNKTLYKVTHLKKEVTDGAHSSLQVKGNIPIAHSTPDKPSVIFYQYFKHSKTFKIK